MPDSRPLALPVTGSAKHAASPVTWLTWIIDDKFARVLHKAPDRDTQGRQLRGGDKQLLHGQGCGIEGSIAGEKGLVAMTTTTRGLPSCVYQQAARWATPCPAVLN